MTGIPSGVARMNRMKRLWQGRSLLPLSQTMITVSQSTGKGIVTMILRLKIPTVKRERLLANGQITLGHPSQILGAQLSTGRLVFFRLWVDGFRKNLRVAIRLIPNTARTR